MQIRHNPDCLASGFAADEGMMHHVIYGVGLASSNQGSPLPMKDINDRAMKMTIYRRSDTPMVIVGCTSRDDFLARPWLSRIFCAVFDVIFKTRPFDITAFRPHTARPAVESSSLPAVRQHRRRASFGDKFTSSPPRYTKGFQRETAAARGSTDERKPISICEWVRLHYRLTVYFDGSTIWALGRIRGVISDARPASASCRRRRWARRWVVGYGAAQCSHSQHARAVSRRRPHVS